MSLLDRILLVWLLLLNLIAFLLYGLDKRKARRNRWRIRESTLLLTAALGGALGALAGIRFFHHKTKHAQFAIGVPALLILETVLLLLFLLWEHGLLPL